MSGRSVEDLVGIECDCGDINVEPIAAQPKFKCTMRDVDVRVLMWVGAPQKKRRRKNTRGAFLELANIIV